MQVLAGPVVVLVDVPMPLLLVTPHAQVRCHCCANIWHLTERWHDLLVRAACCRCGRPCCSCPRHQHPLLPRLLPSPLLNPSLAILS
jgi:hypothetical protein